jgi:hypothetical protein
MFRDHAVGWRTSNQINSYNMSVSTSRIFKKPRNGNRLISSCVLHVSRILIDLLYNR